MIKHHNEEIKIVTSQKNFLLIKKLKQFITIEVKSIIMKTFIKTSCLTLAIFNNVNVFCRCSYRDKKNNTNSSRGGKNTTHTTRNTSGKDTTTKGEIITIHVRALPKIKKDIKISTNETYGDLKKKLINSDTNFIRDGWLVFDKKK